MATYSRKMPDMSRNTALAGQTVYSNGMNVTYDENGYAVRAENPDHSNFAGTTKSVHAQDKDAALRGETYTPPDTSGLIDWGDGTGMGATKEDTREERSTGGAYDKGYLSAYEAVKEAYEAERAAYEAERKAAYEAEKAANDAAVQRAVGQLTAQKSTVNESYDDYARQAYRDKMGAERDIGQYLGARGVTGGAAESTILGLNTSYADELRKIEQSRREMVSALDQAITEAQLTGDLNNAKAAAEAAKESSLLYAQELKERKAAEAAQEQYERAEAQEQQSWARTLVRQMLAAGRMPDDATLAAAGITRSQAELLLPEAQAEETPAYKPTFTVAQVRSEIDNARKYGTPLSANVLRDYEYYYGEPYSATSTAGTAKTYQPSSRKSTQTKSEPIDPSLLTLLDAYAERGMTPAGLMAVLERWVTEKKITAAQRDQIAKSFGC